MVNKNFDNGNPFDFGKISLEYAKYRDIYPEEFYEQLINLNIGVKNQKILDLGTGTGVLPRNMYKYGASWVGCDISKNQIKYAKQLSEEKNMNIQYICSSAEDIDFPDESFDIITACQCFGYFEKRVILPKIYRILKNKGRFVILFMAWLSNESKIAQKSEELILKYNPDWTGGRITRYKLNEPDWAKEYFVMANGITFDIPVTFSRESWHGRIKTCRGIGASILSDKDIKNWESEHLSYLSTVPEVFDVLHYVTILDLKKK